MRIFDNVKGINESELIDRNYKEQIKEYSTRLKNMKSEYEKKSKELIKLEAMMVESSEGLSQFTPERLNRRMDTVDNEIKSLEPQICEMENKLDEKSQLLEQIRNTYSELISWAEVFSDASDDMQKMITAYLIKKVTVHRDYELEIEYNFDEGQFIQGLGL
jgi:chromosome segregation ATPase